MFGIHSAAHSYTWAIFVTAVVAMLLVDLLFINRKAHKISTREAAVQSLIWIGLSVIVGIIVWLTMGASLGAQYFTGYIIEKSLSVDNIFVWGLVLTFFRVPAEYRHRVLFWGIFGALVMRFIFIVAGVAVINKFAFVVPLLGLVLIWSAIKILKSGDDDDYSVEDSRPYKFFSKHLRVTKEMYGGKFFVRVPLEQTFRQRMASRTALMATPLFLCLLVVEVTDVIFAVDSVPAILAIARDPFVIFASNAMAILGLRALFFLFDAIKDKFEHLGTGVAIVLAYVGVKMILQSEMSFGFFHLPGFHIPTTLSLGIIAAVLGASVLLSKGRPAAEVE
jgi:tellurite resistance protein TerC